MRVTSDPTPCHVVATVADVVVVVDAVALAREAVHADAAPDHAHEAALVDAVAVAPPGENYVKNIRSKSHTQPLAKPITLPIALTRCSPLTITLAKPIPIAS